MSEVEVLPSNDVLTCLWNKNAAEKCRIGLSDVVIYDGGTPARWYFTGKTGEILKKRAVDFESISTRWKRICSLSQVVTQPNPLLSYQPHLPIRRFSMY